MKKTERVFKMLTLVVLVTISLTACNGDDSKEAIINESALFDKNSPMTGLLKSLATNLVQDTDAIDSVSCFNVKIPFKTYLFDGQIGAPSTFLFEVNDGDDLIILNNFIINENKKAFYSYPVTLVYDDFSEIFVGSSNQYNTHQLYCASTYNGNCLSIVFPIQIKVYDDSNFGSEAIAIYEINNNSELFLTLTNLQAHRYRVSFPISVLDSQNNFTNLYSLHQIQQKVIEAIENCY